MEVRTALLVSQKVKRFFLAACLGVLACCATTTGVAAAPPKKILLVTTTLGYRHSSIETAEQVIATLGKSSGAYEVELAAVSPAAHPDGAAVHDPDQGSRAAGGERAPDAVAGPAGRQGAQQRRHRQHAAGHADQGGLVLHRRLG